MSRPNPEVPILAFLFLLACTIATPAQAPDNSGNNKQPAVTADQQSNAAADRAITQKIRKSLIVDKSLSTYAHNIKIITTDGVVTLKGPVKSDDEKQKVASKAAEVVDASKIDNELTVKDE
jgi:hyperosmotically inducible periplasmic protein